MSTKKSFSDQAKLERYQAALTKAKTKPEINQSLIRIGVSNEILDEGSTLYDLASAAFARNYDAKR